MGKYTFEDNTYNIEDYDELFPFSSFLPGIAGVKGIPLWLFYTNRGQCVNSFGIHDKDHAIMEFNPANTAYENTSIKGFRTFMKINGTYYEPFHGYDGDYKRRMHIRDNSFWIEEMNDKMESVGFQNPDGEIILVVMNKTGEVQQFEILVEGKSCSIELDAHTIMTAQINTEMVEPGNR